MPLVVVSGGLGWGGTLAWASAVLAVVLLGLAARWVARPAKRAPQRPRRVYHVPPQHTDPGDNSHRTP